MYDSNLSLLWFPSGMRWSFGCSSRGMEGDETALYPTLVEDTNGNQIIIGQPPRRPTTPSA